MNPLSILTRPVSDVFGAVSALGRFIFVVGLCYLINAVTSPGQWWAHWVAFGMGIALIVALARALKSVLGAVIVGAIGVWLYKRYGAEAREKFDALWAARKGGEVQTSR
jgi:ABC-type Fe3+ transport system permease subunit